MGSPVGSGIHFDQPRIEIPRKPPWDRSIGPSLLMKVLTWLAPREGAIIVDGTVGGGGHTSLLSRRVGKSATVIGLDRDPAMLAMAEEAVRGLPQHSSMPLIARYAGCSMS